MSGGDEDYSSESGYNDESVEKKPFDLREHYFKLFSNHSHYKNLSTYFYPESSEKYVTNDFYNMSQHNDTECFFSYKNDTTTNLTFQDYMATMCSSQNNHSSLQLWKLILTGSLASFISLLTITGNLIVIISFILERSIRQPNNYFIASLAVSDLLIGSVSMPFFTQYLMQGEKWLLSNYACDLWLSTDYTVCLTSIYTVLCITIDRYCSVTIPAKYRDWRTERRVLLIITATWIIPIFVFFPSIFGWHNFGKRTVRANECYVQYLENVAFNICLQVGYFWSTLFIMCVLYAGIYRVALRMAKKADKKYDKMNTIVSVAGQTAATLSMSRAKQAISQTVLIPSRNQKSIVSSKHQISIQASDSSSSTYDKSPQLQTFVSPKTNSLLSKTLIDNETFDGQKSILHAIISTQNSIPCHNTIPQNSQPEEKYDTNEKKELSDGNYISDEADTDKNGDNVELKELSKRDDNKLESHSFITGASIMVSIATTTSVTSPLTTTITTSHSTTQTSQQTYQAPNDEDPFTFSSPTSYRKMFPKKPNENTQLLTNIQQNNCNYKTARNSDLTPVLSCRNREYFRKKQKKICHPKSTNLQKIRPTFKTLKRYFSANDAFNRNEKPTYSRTASERPLEVKNENIPKPKNIRRILKSSFLKKQKNGVLSTIANKKKNRGENRARKALRTITVILGAFVICWTPWHLISMLMVLFPSLNLSLIYSISYWLCYMNSPINPFCYALANQQFKKAFVRIIRLDWHRT